MNTSLRAAPASGEPNNQDLFVWALYVLGGSDRDVDVEEVYLRSFELAPARLGWRTRPEIPDYKKTAKALQSVEATTHRGLIAKRGSYRRRLTAEGVRWVEQNRPVLESLYGGSATVAEVPSSALGRRRSIIRRSKQFIAWLEGSQMNLLDLADALECSPTSPAALWKARVEEIRRVAAITGDSELDRFASTADTYVTQFVKG